MKKLKLLTLAGLSLPVFLSACGTQLSKASKTDIETQKINQSSHLAQILYEINQSYEQVPLYIPKDRNTGYIFTSGYYVEFAGNQSELKVLRSLKKSCEKDGGRFIREVSAGEGFTAKIQVEEYLKEGDKCEVNGKEIFELGKIYRGSETWYSSSGGASWTPTVYTIYHSFPIKGVKPYTKLVPANPEYEGKKATEVFKPSSISEFFNKIQGLRSDYGNFVVDEDVINDKGVYPSKWKIINKMIAFCNANNGTLYKDGISFDKYLTDVIIEKSKLNFSNGHIFAGRYVCDAPNGFTILLKRIPNPETDTYNYWYKVITKNEVEKVSNVNNVNINNSDNSDNQSNITSTAGFEASDIALKISNTKKNIINKVGAITYIGKYNGKNEEGCDLVSIEKTIGGKFNETLNYKVCKKKVIPLPYTNEILPKNIEFKGLILAKACRLYGVKQMKINNYELRCFPLNDFKRCEYEVRYFRDDALIKSKKFTVCK